MAEILDGLMTGYKVKAAVIPVDVVLAARPRVEENHLSQAFVLYILIVAVSAVACGFAIRAARPLPERRRSTAKHDCTEIQSPDSASRTGDPGASMARAAVTPAPWGWPSATGAPRSAAARRMHAREASSALQRWADQLVTEKRTLDDQGYKVHREECIRALLEDRFCSQKRGSATDSSSSLNGHDREPRNAVAGRRQQPESPTAGRSAPVSLGDVRKPWGW